MLNRRAYIDYPIEVRAGTGAVRAWLQFDQARVASFTADLSLAKLWTRLGPELEPLSRVLRAAGMTRGQVRRTVVVEAGILGIVGSVLGIATGLVAGAILIVLGGSGALILDPPWVPIGVALGLGIGVAMVAAWYPARLASRLAIAAAVQHE